MTPVASSRRRSRESGYAYIMAMFIMVVMIVASQAILQNAVTQGRREREKDMVWRGEQYERAIRLYFRKTGHYPQTVDDLQKGMPELQFLRAAAYKDPMNTADGSWRFIYINSAGQIIGSVRYATLQQMALMDLNGGQLPTALTGTGLGVPASSLASASQGNSSAQTNSQPATSDSSSSQSPSGATNNSAAGPQNPAGAASSSALAALGQLQPTGAVDGPVIGGFLTGVASKIDRTSIRVYKGGKTYKEWEFIWNPLEDQARSLQNGLMPQGAQPGQPGIPIANPMGGGTGFGGSTGGPSPGGAGGSSTSQPSPGPGQTPNQ